MENNPTYVVSDRGTKIWRLNGKLHREDGPAVEYLNGDKRWYLNGVLHRLDGPALIFSKSFRKCWYINDCHITDEIKKWASNNDIDLDNLTDVDKALIKIVWADYGK